MTFLSPNYTPVKVDKRRRNRKEFVETWMRVWKAHGNQSDIAEALGISKQAVSYRGLYLRSRGVKLPHLNRISRIETSELNDLIDKIEANQLHKDILSLVGEDLDIPESEKSLQEEVREDLRAELREKINKYFGESE